MVRFANNFEVASISGKSRGTRTAGSSVTCVELVVGNYFDEKIRVVEGWIPDAFDPDDVAGRKVVPDLRRDDNLIAVLLTDKLFSLNEILVEILGQKCLQLSK